MTHSKPGAPRVSIVLTTLDGARYLREAMDSCLGQTMADLELIVVDGGSTDGTVAIVESYDDPRVQLVHQRGNQGRLPGAINVGLAHARGAYLTWMQDDCRYHPEAIAVMVAELDRHPDVGHVYCDYWVVDEAGQRMRRQATCEPDEILSAPSDPCGVCFMIRRSAREQVGEHDVAAYPTQDYDYRLRLAMAVRSRHIEQAPFDWRIHPHSLSGSRPWTVDARNDARIRRRLGLADRAAYLRSLAAIDVAWAFEEYARQHWLSAARHALVGILRDPRHALNRGVWSILARSSLRSLAAASPWQGG